MSATIDSRIVSMKFDNTDFEKGARTSLNTLAQISKALAFPGVGAGISGIQKMMGGFHSSMSGMGGAVDGISGKFVALTTVAATAIASVTQNALAAASSFVKQASGLSAMQAGFEEYELKLGSIQSILANTKGESLEDVNHALEQLNRYSDKTIYNFGEMVSNIKQFTVAGIDLKTSVAAVKGLANVAALTGTNSQEAARATYQMAQAMSSGTVRLQDWISMEHAGGMAGRVFQDALIRTAEVHGVNVREMIKTNGSFRLSLQEDWLTADIMNETLGQMAGVYNKAELARMGYTESQIKSIIKLQKEAEAAATDVKTFSALVSTLKETMGSGWAKTWELLFGNLKESTDLWTGVNNAVGGFISRSANARNRVLQDWKELGGRTDLIEGIKNIFEALIAIVKPIRNAFRDIFPRATGEQLANITEKFREFTEKLIVSKETSGNIRDVFRAVFTVFKIGAVIVGSAIKYIAEFFGILIGGGGGSAILSIAAAIGRVISAIGGWLLEGDKLKNFFDAITDARNAVLEPLVGTIGKIVEAFVELFSGNTGGFFEKLGEAGSIFGGLIDIVQSRIEQIPGMLATAFAAVGSFLQSVGSSALEPIIAMFDNMSGLFEGLQDKLSFGVEVSSGGIDEATKKIEKLGFVGELVRNIWDGLINAFQKVGQIAGPVSDGIGGVFGTIVDKVSSFIEGLTFQEAIALLNTGFLLIIWKNLNGFISNLKGITKVFRNIGESIGGTFDQLTDTMQSMQNAIRAHTIKQIAISIGILALSLIGLAMVPADDLKKGLGALSILAGEVMIMMGIMGKLSFGGGTLAIGPALIGMAVAINLLAVSMLAMKKVGWEEIGKVGTVLAGLAAAAYVLGTASGTMILAAAGILILAPAMILFAGVIKLYSAFEWETIGKGLLFIVGAILAVALAVNTMTASIPGALGMLIVAGALVVLAKAVKILGEMKLWDLIKGVGALALILPVIAATSNAMVAALPGAAAMIVMAYSIKVLAEAIKLMGEMKWNHLLLGLGGLIAIFVIIGVASAALAPVVPVILALGAAILVLGAGMALVGAGMFLFATGLATLATLGGAGAAALTAVLLAIGSVLPVLAQQLGLAVIAFAEVIGNAAPIIVGAISDLMTALFDHIEQNAPEFGEALSAMIAAGLEVVRENGEPFIKTSFWAIRQFLSGLRQNMPDIVAMGTDIIISFLRGIRKKMDDITAEGILILAMALKGIARNIDEVSKQGVNIIIQFIDGINKRIKRLIDKGAEFIVKVIEGIGDNLDDIINAGIGLVIKFMYGIAAGIDQNAGAIGSAAGAIVWAVVRAIPAAVAGAVSTVASNFQGMVNEAWSRVNIPGKLLDLLGLAPGGKAPGGDWNPNKEGKAFESEVNRLRTLVDDGLSVSMDFSPKITPILDLSEFRRNTSQMKSIFDSNPIKTDVSYQRAQSVSQGRDEILQLVAALREQPTEKKEIKYEQHLHSPKYINRVEAYRATKNLLAFAKEEMDIS